VVAAQLMFCELQSDLKEVVLPWYSTVPSYIHGDTEENNVKYSMCPNQGLNPAPLEYKWWVLPLH
jgi:hypothetical protein